MINDAFNIIRKGGAVVLTGLAPTEDLNALCRWRGSRCSGSGCSAVSTARPTRAPTFRGCSTSTATGQLLLDETVTREYKLADINEGFDDMLAGRNIRGVILHDH